MRFSPYIAASALLSFSFASSVHRRGHQEFHGKLIQAVEQNIIATSLPIIAQTIIHPITNALEASSIASSPTPIAGPYIHTPKRAHVKKDTIKTPTSHASSSIRSPGSPWSMTYSPYTSSGDCKSTAAITTDVASIASKGFSSIRIYSTDCNGLSSVASAASSRSLNLILGVYISDEGIAAARPQIQEIVSWARNNGGGGGGRQWQAVEMIVVGNEAVFNGFCTPQELAAFVAEARSAFRAAGYSGPVTTAETINVFDAHRDTLCPVSDVVAANIHPFFNGRVAAPDAGQFVKDQLALLETDICPGKRAWNLESGWPKAGSANGVAVPGARQQEVAVLGILREVGERSAFFGFEDELWKEEGEWGVERSFG
ncbi:MAG: hypothetical protein Q9216_006928, partial [Gyalolechia sp. 2 TL-2023]